MPIRVANKTVGPIGYGMISISNPANKVSTEDAIATLKAAFEAGSTFWNAGELYGTPDWNSLHILNAYFTKYPEDAEKVFISVKGCYDMRAVQGHNDPEGVRRSIDNCLRILDGKCRIDLFEPARVDREIPVEVTVGAIAEYVKDGRIGSAGLSECSAASLRKAHAVSPIAAVEVELSLFETTIYENGLADACKELGVPIIAYGTLAKGFLGGKLKKYEDLPEHDHRRFFPRYLPQNFDENLKLVAEVKRVAEKKGCTTGQIAIAWVLAQGNVLGVPVIPIPGTSSIERLQENMKQVKLTDEELKELNEIVRSIEVKGTRYPAKFMELVNI